MEQVANAALASENTFLKRQLVERNAVLAEVSINLKKQTVYNIALLEETIVLKKKLNAANTVIKEHVTEEAILENLASENIGLAAESNALKKQLTAVNETLRKQVDSTALKQHQAGEDLVKIAKSMDTWRAREEELVKKLEDLKTRLKESEEDNFLLNAELQLQHQINVIEANNSKATSLKNTNDLMKVVREAEEKLCAQEEDSEEEQRMMDEEVKLLIQQNIEVRYIRSF